MEAPKPGQPTCPVADHCSRRRSVTLPEFTSSVMWASPPITPGRVSRNSTTQVDGSCRNASPLSRFQSAPSHPFSTSARAKHTACSAVVTGGAPQLPEAPDSAAAAGLAAMKMQSANTTSLHYGPPQACTPNAGGQPRGTPLAASAGTAELASTVTWLSSHEFLPP